MNKKTIKLFSILIASTALASALFISLQVLFDILFGSEHVVSIIFSETRTFFDLLAEYTAYAVILFSFCRFKLEDALKSFIFAGASFLFAVLFQLGGTIVFNVVKTPDLTTFAIVMNSINSLSSFITLSIITRVIPCIVLAILAYKLTKNKAITPQKFISFKNEITRAMGIFTLVLFAINLVSKIFLDVSYIPTITKSDFFARYGSWGNYFFLLLPDYLSIIVYYLVFIYCTLFFGYKLFDKYTDINVSKK